MENTPVKGDLVVTDPHVTREDIARLMRDGDLVPYGWMGLYFHRVTRGGE